MRSGEVAMGQSKLAVSRRGARVVKVLLLRETRVASLPGEAFFHDDGGESLLRFCYAKEDAELEAGSSRLMGLAK